MPPQGARVRPARPSEMTSRCVVRQNEAREGLVHAAPGRARGRGARGAPRRRDDRVSPGAQRDLDAVVLPHDRDRLAGRPRHRSAQRRVAGDLDRPRDRRTDYLCVRCCDPGRGDHGRRLHGRAGRAKETAHDRAPERSLHHLRLRPRGPQGRGRVPRVRDRLRRARLQQGRDRGGGGGGRPLRRGHGHRGRGPSGGRARPGARARRVVRLGRGQPLHRALGAGGAAGPADRRAGLRRGRGPEAAARGRRPRRSALLDGRQGDGEARPAAAGGRVPGHRLDERRPGVALRGDRGQGDVRSRGQVDPRAPGAPGDGRDDRRAAQAGRDLRHDARRPMRCSTSAT